MSVQWHKWCLVIILTVPITAIAKMSDRACIAVALHYESRGESLRGVRSVYDVILNRIKNSGKSACHVLKQRGQFAFVNRQTHWKPTYEMLFRLDSVKSMKRVVDKSALWYYSTVIRKPRYLRGMVFVRQVGKHRFYRLKLKEK